MLYPKTSPVLLVLLAALSSSKHLAAARHCQHLNLNVPLTANNTIFSLDAPSNNAEVTDLILNLTQAGANFVQDSETGTAQISGTYRVGATYCDPGQPSSASKGIQVLSHGIGFDRTYWDFPDYSYVDQALARGYATFAYDRLGSGASRVSSLTGGDLDPVQELQSSLEVSLLRTLTKSLRAGDVPQLCNASFARVLHVGHSLGSITIYGAVAVDPEISDGIALTGFTPNGSYVPYFQFASDFVSAAGGSGSGSGNDSDSESDYPDGYLTFGTSSALHTNQFGPGGVFDTALLDPLFDELQATGVGTILTLAGPLNTVNGFQGPVIDVTGCECTLKIRSPSLLCKAAAKLISKARDLPFCGGNCETAEPSLPAQVGTLFPNASAFEAVIVPGAGHALNLVSLTSSSTLFAPLFPAKSNGIYISRDGSVTRLI